MTKKETVLSALDSALQQIVVNVECEYRRDDVEPDTLPENGLLLLFDGDPGEPVDVVLSPVVYFWQHRARLVAAVENNDPAERISKLDNILKEVQSIIDADKTLGGVCDYVETLPPEEDTEQTDGTPAIKRAFVDVVLHYNSTGALA